MNHAMWSAEKVLPRKPFPALISVCFEKMVQTFSIAVLVFMCSWTVPAMLHAGGAEWSEQSLAPVWQACDDGVVAVDRQLEALAARFAEDADSMSADEFIKHVQQGTLFGQLAIVIWPYHIPEKVRQRMFTSAFMDCWANMYEIAFSARNNGTRQDLRHACDKWHTCIGANFRGDTPAIVKPLSDCYEKAIEQYTPKPAQTEPAGKAETPTR